MADAYSLPATSEEWVPFEVGEVKWLRNTDGTQSGFWRCTTEQQPDVHEAEFSQDETIYVVRGRLSVEVVGGPTVECGVGDSASFVKGTVGRWTILEDVEEFFVYH